MHFLACPEPVQAAGNVHGAYFGATQPFCTLPIPGFLSTASCRNVRCCLAARDRPMRRHPVLLVSELAEAIQSPGFADFLSCLDQLIKGRAESLAVPVLRKSLRNPETDIQCKAALALSEIGPPA